MSCGSACLRQMCGAVDQFDYKKAEPKGGSFLNLFADIRRRCNKYEV
jgi:hypothetical protein